MLASKNGHQGVVDSLLAHGADVNITYVSMDIHIHMQRVHEYNCCGIVLLNIAFRYSIVNILMKVSEAINSTGWICRSSFVWMVHMCSIGICSMTCDYIYVYIHTYAMIFM